MKIKPQKLNKGDTIGIISPAGEIKEKKLFDNAVKYFESKGYKVKIARHALDKKDYLAGNDENRLSDLMDFFRDDEIKAILCSRGGYGTFRILNKINFNLIQQNPKIFAGYSDITALLNNFTEKSNIVTFHSPLAVSDFGKDTIDEYTEDIFWKILLNETEIPYCFPNVYDYHCIKPGKTEGELVGGNLSIICGLVGTPFCPDFSNKILFLEDVGEPIYKIDRMLAQLKLAGVFEKISGLLFTEFTSANSTPLDIASELAENLNIPVGYGFPAGHGAQKVTLPLGVKYLFDAANFKLELTEEYLRVLTK